MISSVTSHNEFLLTNNVLEEYNKVNEEMKNLKALSRLSKILVYFQNNFTIVWNVEKIQKVKIQKFQGKKSGRIMLLSECVVCDSKKAKFIKEKESGELLSSLGI